MAKQVVKVGYVTLATVDYSALIESAELVFDAETGDTSNYASAGWKENAPGMKSGTLNINFKKDGDLSGLDAALYTIFNGTGTAAFVAAPTSSAASSSNVHYSGTVVVTQMTTGPGPLGQVYAMSVSWPLTGAPTRNAGA